MKKCIEVTIEGISPLLMHKFPLTELPEGYEKRPPEEQAELSAYRTSEGQLYVPGTALQRSLVAAAVYSKGKGRATLQKPVAACVMIPNEYLLLNLDNYRIDSRPVVIRATKGRIMRHRPCFPDWKIDFTLDYDDGLLSAKQLREVVDNAGSRVGLLDFRPECKGPFGRFIVIGWGRV